MSASDTINLAAAVAVGFLGIGSLWLGHRSYRTSKQVADLEEKRDLLEAAVGCSIVAAGGWARRRAS